MHQNMAHGKWRQVEDKLGLGQDGFETEMNPGINTVVQLFPHKGRGRGHYSDSGRKYVKGTERGSRVIRCQVRKNDQ